MELVTIAKPYANAVFEIAQQDSNHAQWKAVLEAASQLIADDNMQAFIAAPSTDAQQKSDAILRLTGSILGRELEVKESAFLNLLLENDRTSALSDILALFEDQLNVLDDAKAFTVISAYKLSAKEEKQLVSDLTEKYNTTVSIDTVVDKDLVGGVIIKQGDKVTDMSVQARTNELGLRLLTTH